MSACCFSSEGAREASREGGRSAGGRGREREKRERTTHPGDSVLTLTPLETHSPAKLLPRWVRPALLAL